MILCSCEKISSNSIKQYLTSQSKTGIIISVGTVIKGLGCRVTCGVCAASIRKEIEQFYKEKKDVY